jgi:hypothetical protein
MTLIRCSLVGVYFLVAVLPGLLRSQTTTQGRRHRSSSAAREMAAGNCYDPSDPNLIRLWPGRAPGAVGENPCGDIPYLRVFTASSQMRSAKPVILIIPGGGYDRLTDTKEQTPVAEHFVENLRVTAIVLYYRLVQRSLLPPCSKGWNISLSRTDVGWTEGGQAASVQRSATWHRSKTRGGIRVFGGRSSGEHISPAFGHRL